MVGCWDWEINPISPSLEHGILAQELSDFLPLYIFAHGASQYISD
jgi:hypothetical protein